MCNLHILSAPAGLAIAIVLFLVPALNAEDALLFEANVLEVIVVVLIAGQVFLETHIIKNNGCNQKRE